MDILAVMMFVSLPFRYSWMLNVNLIMGEYILGALVFSWAYAVAERIVALAMMVARSMRSLRDTKPWSAMYDEEIASSELLFLLDVFSLSSMTI